MTAEALPREFGDMPTREGDLKIEQRGIEPIPVEARYGSLNRVFTVWFTPNLVPAAFFIGTLVTLPFLKLGFTTGLVAIVVGNIVGSVLVGILATMGPRTGMAQMPLARLAFGKSIVVPGLLNWISCIGWDGINNLFGAVALTILIPAIPFPVALLIIVGAQALLGVIGHEGIHTFERVMAVVLGAMFVVLTISIAGQGSTTGTDGFSGVDLLGAFIAMVAIVASFVLAWCLYASDYTRYLPPTAPRSRVFGYTVLGLTLSATWLEILGLLVATKATGGESSDTINTILGGGVISALAMVAIVLGTVAVNALNDYTGSLSLQAAGIRVPRVVSAIVVAALGFAFTLYLYSGNLAAKFTNFLLFIGYWVTPWAAVVLTDWWMRRGRVDPLRLMDFVRLPSGAAALVALVVGFLASVPFQNSSLGYDIATALPWLPINWATVNVFHGADLAYLVGFVVAAVVYAIGARSAVSAPEETEGEAAAS